MRYSHCWLVLLLFAPAAPAQTPSVDLVKAAHEYTDRNWARKSGLPVAEVRAIRNFAGISGTSPYGIIRNLEVKALGERNQILLVDAGVGCTRVRVLEAVGRDFSNLRELWHFPGVPDPVWGLREEAAGRENCAGGKGDVNAHVGADGSILVEVRRAPDAFQRTIPADSYRFSWTGSRYRSEAGAQ